LQSHTRGACVFLPLTKYRSHFGSRYPLGPMRQRGPFLLRDRAPPVCTRSNRGVVLLYAVP
jgi:hypothetical protein